MTELLSLLIGALLLAGVVVLVRSRRQTGDPAGSVDAFHRALTAMEPGAGDGQASRRADERADVEPGDAGHADPSLDPGAPRG